jgi:squalene-hopene/tetraprenyl-beta-curcumene cyclase
MKRLALPILLLAVTSVAAQEPAKTAVKPRPKPTLQYESGEIRISLPSASDPKVAEFGPESIRAAAKYLDDGAVAWLRERNCQACHTPGAYMLDRPALTPWLGKPEEVVLGRFIAGIQDDLPATKEAGGITYYALAERAVWRAAGLVEWDRHVTGTLSDHTDRALRSMLRQQASHGGWYMPGEVEIPYETTDFELTLHAARAVVEAPGWLATLKDPELLGRIDRMKTFLAETKPRNDYERALRIGLASFLPEIVPRETRESDIAMLWAKQHDDGGWCTRDMSDTRNWRTPMSDFVIKLIEGLPDAANPQCDPFMTAQAILLLRESGVPANDRRIQKGIAWLKAEQRVGGRWWMHSLYRGNFNFITYIATAKAMKALGMCGELVQK